MSRRRWLTIGLVAIVGGFLFWMQVGLAAGLGFFATGANAFRGALGNAADQLAAGDFDVAVEDFAQTQGAASRMEWSARLPQVALLEQLRGAQPAVTNWMILADATTAVTAGTGELLNLYGQLSGKTGDEKVFSDGTVNLALVRSLPPRVADADDNITTSIALLNRIDANGPLAGPLESARRSALRQAKPVQDAIGGLRDFAPLLPDALGANGERRYLIAIGNQAEMRASGGAPLSLVMVEFNEGRIDIPIKGTTSVDLFPPVNRPVTWFGPASNPFFPLNPRTAPFVTSNTHPNLLTSAREMAGAWVAGGYPTVDGVVTLDLTAIAAILDATGPIESAEYGLVTGEDIGRILLVDAYAQFGQEGAEERQDANQRLLEELIGRLLSGDDAVTAARALVSTAPGRHFQVWMRSPGLESLALETGAAGQVRDPGGGDWSAVFTQNGNQSKVDVFQQRNVVVNVRLADDGSATVRQDVVLTNATPPDRPVGPAERIGYETMWARNAYLMYIPVQARNFTARYPPDFVVRPFRNHVQYGLGFTDDGYGQKLVRVVGWTPPGGQSTVSVSYELPPGTFLPSAGSPTIAPARLVYTLVAEPQSIWNPSTLTVRVTAPPGWNPVEQEGALVTGNTIEVSAVQEGPVRIRLPFQRGVL